MVAQVRIMRWTSASGTPVKTNIDGGTNRAGTADDPAPGTSYPIPVPTDSNLRYSYWVCTRLSAFYQAQNGIQNLKWYTDGANGLGTGVDLNVATASTYVQAPGTVGTTGTLLNSNNYGSLSAAVTSAWNYVSSNMLSVGGSIGSITGDIGHFVVYQVQVSSNAGPGATNSEQLTWQYDET